MILLVPELTPVTSPPELTVATDVLLLAQVPPDVASVKVVVPPAHTLFDPDIAATVGVALIVTEEVAVWAEQPPAAAIVLVTV